MPKHRRQELCTNNIIHRSYNINKQKKNTLADPFSSPFLFLAHLQCGNWLIFDVFLLISISRQVASGAMLEPAPHTPPIYHPCATPWMATCLWMVAMLTMSQVRFIAPLTKASALSESLQPATWQPSSSSPSIASQLLTN